LDKDENGAECPTNECSCTDGLGALGPDYMPSHNNITTNPNSYGLINNPAIDSTEGKIICPRHGNMHCATCFSGFHLDGNIDEFEGGQECPINECGCTNGIGALGPDYMSSNNNATTNPNFYKFVNNPAVNSVEGKILCPRHGNMHCATCFSGFHLDGNVDALEGGQECPINECGCVNGIGALGPDYMSSNSNATTNPNFYKFINNPAVNSVEGKILCPRHQTMHCATCFSGYHLDGNIDPFEGGQECPINECSCVNGIGALGPDHIASNNNITTNPNSYGFINNPTVDSAAGKALCPRHGNSHCATCFTGFHLDGNIDPLEGGQACPINECTCVNGLGAFGPDYMASKNNGTTNPNSYGLVNNPAIDSTEGSILCPRHGNNHCATCFSGFHLDGNIDANEGGQECPINECSCSNGIGALGPDYIPCNDNSTTNPSSDSLLNNPTCSSTEGKILCPNHGDSLCATCFTGFHLNSGACDMNVCQCNNGNGIVGPVSNDGQLCDSNGMFKCLNCDTGYHLDNFECPMN
jgi:hypothetical protein